MKKLDLNNAADIFEEINSDTNHFYNVETGEFDYYGDFMGLDEVDTEKFEDDVWVALPSSQDLGDYDIMSDFADTVSDSNKSDLLYSALDGRGAFRRFRDALDSVDLTDKWYAFKRKAYINKAREWCEYNDIEYIDVAEEHDDVESQKQAEDPSPESQPISVTLLTLESHNHYVGDIERGVKIFNSGKVESMEFRPGVYMARVPHKGSFKTVSVTFTRDGRDIMKFCCDCSSRDRNPPVCRHLVAAVLALQNGVVETKLALGNTATVKTVVTASNTAKAVGSGSLDVFATPMLVALMEQAACKCLDGCMDIGQTSVGTMINIEHSMPSPIGSTITATATIEYVFGRRIELILTATDGSEEIGKGKHTRLIVDEDRFIKKALGRLGD
ncbi:MAG: UPF0158 family protein [Oscillospiraceae bacterium]|nr:UPF0158 family protein [Oscillospiraceae bacterium]